MPKLHTQKVRLVKKEYQNDKKYHKNQSWSYCHTEKYTAKQSKNDSELSSRPGQCPFRTPGIPDRVHNKGTKALSIFTRNLSYMHILYLQHFRRNLSYLVLLVGSRSKIVIEKITLVEIFLPF